MAFTGFIADVIEPKHTVETWAYVRWQFQCAKCDDDSSGSIVVDCQRLVAASQLKKKVHYCRLHHTRVHSVVGSVLVSDSTQGEFCR